ncbi:immunoglobulin-like domain-containing protein [Gorillibacterium sp. sgz5001074]|uniref:immunoglobulin-like domain-containing protein n=1 Tax=Gorillibacterium sp. sgz5001074 TaxID=3446695 RepID=UPI003F677A1C
MVHSLEGRRLYRLIPLFLAALLVGGLFSFVLTARAQALSLSQFTAGPNTANNAMELSWVNPDDTSFSKIKIYRQTGTDTGSWSFIKEGSLSSYTDVISGIKLYTTYYYKLEAYNKSNQLMGEPLYASARLRAGPITFSSWALENSGTATFANHTYYELRAEFLAEENISSIAYEYSLNGTTWLPFVELASAAVTKKPTGEWYRAVKTDLYNLPDGTHKIRATAKDVSGDILTEERTFLKDATRPNGVTNASADVSTPDTHKLAWVNPSSDFHHVVIQRRIPDVNNSWSDVTATHQGNEYSVSAISGLTYEYAISTYDAVGNKSVQTVPLTVQSPMTAPVVDEMKPDANSITNEKNVSYSVKIRDNVPVTSILVEASANGGPWQPVNASTQAPTAKNNYYSVSGTYNLESYGEATLVLRATAKDTLNRTVTADRTFTVDRVAPAAPANLTATTQSNGSLISWSPVPGAKSYTMTRLADDVNGIGAAIWTINAPGVSYVDGGVLGKPATYTVSAKDAAGNIGPESKVTTLRTNGPSLTLTAGNEVYTNQPAYTVRGTTTPGATVTVNGVAAAVGSNGAFSASITLQPGVQTLTVNATQTSGTTTLKQKVVLDQDKPSVTGLTPADDSVVNGYNKDLYVTATDPGASGFDKIEFQVSLTDGLSWKTFGVKTKAELSESNYTTYSNGNVHLYWNTFTPIDGVGELTDGPYKFRVLVYDRAGNVSDGIPVRIWLVDNTSYRANIGVPSGFKAENKIEEIKLTWIKNVDTYTKKYRILRSTSPTGAFTELTTTTYDYYSDKTVFNGTKYYYKIQALTNEGVESPLSAPLEAEALIDTIASPINSTTPAEGARIGGAAPYMDVYFNENSRKPIASIQLQYSRNAGQTWSNALSYKTGPHSGWSYDYYRLYLDSALVPEGSLLFKITITDADGNVTVKTLTLTVDLTAEVPVLSSMTSVDGMVLMQWNPITAEDYDRIFIYRADKRDGIYYNYKTETNAAVTSYTDNSVTPGSVYYYKLVFQDKTGNQGETAIFPIQVVDDAQKPVIHFIAPATGATIGGDSLTISTKLSDNRSVTGTKAEYSRDGGKTWTLAADGFSQSGTYYYGWNLKGLPEGTYIVRISAWDAANNIATADVTYTLDKTVSPVTSYQVIPEENSILLKWTPITDPDLPDYHPYRILRSTTPGGPYGSEISLGKTETQYRITDLNPKTTYYFVIKTVDKYGNVAYSQEKSASYLADTTPPVVVSITPATGSTIGGTGEPYVKLEFRENAGYVGTSAVFEYTTDGTIWTPLQGTVGGPNANGTLFYFAQYWKIKDLPSGTYSVRLTVKDASGNTASATAVYEMDHTPPAAPKNLIGRYGSGIVNLTWEKPADVDLKKYKLYRATSEQGPFTVIKDDVAKTAVSYTDSTIQYGLTYYYKLTAVDQFDQEGAVSNVAAAYALQDSIPPSVQNITPASGTVLSPTTSITVTGTDNLSVSSILLQISTDGGATWTEVGTKAASGNSATFDLATVTFNGPIQIRAVAYDSFGNASTGGPVRSYTLDGQGPGKVTGLRTVPGETTVYLKWNAVTDADIDYYTVEKKGPTDPDFVAVGTSDGTIARTITGLERLKTYQFRVVGYDTRGNRGTPSDPVTVTTVSDGQPPVISELGPNGGSYDQSVPLTVKATDNIGTVGLKLQYSLDRQAWTDIVTLEEGSGTASYPWNTSALAEGTYYVRAVAWDGAGNISDQTGTAKFVQFAIDHTPPAIPTGFKAAANAYSIVLTWTAPAEADHAGMNIYKAEALAGPYTLLKGKQAGTTYTDEAVTTGKIYYYKISSVDRAGLEGGQTAAVSAQLPADTAAPAITSLTPADGSMLGSNPVIKVKASDNYRLAQVTLEYRKKGASAWTPLYAAPVTGRTADVDYTWNTSQLEEVPYEVRVQAKDASGLTSSWMTFTYTLNMYAPKAPVLSGTPGGWTASLTWTGNTESDFKEYRIYRSLVVDGSFEKIHTTTALAYTDKSVNPGVRYYYLVEAADTYGNTSRSNVISLVPTNEDAILPVARIEYTGSTYLGDTIQFNGLKSTDNVRIDRYEWNFGDNGTSIIGEPTHSYMTEGTFNVTLKVYDPKGNSNTATVRIVVVDQPVKPTGLSAEPGDQQAYLTWSANPETNVTGYHVYGLVNGAWSRYTTTSVTGTSYLLKGLTNGTEYVLAVTAVNQAGIESEKSQSVPVTPAVQQVKTVAQAISSNTGLKQTVAGYIVGTTASGTAALPFDFAAPFPTATTLLLADQPGETAAGKILVVHLSSGVARAALNLMDNPLNDGKKLRIKGDLQAYLQQPGMTNITLFELLSMDLEDVTADRDALQIGFASGDSISSVTSNVTLPVTGAKGSAITWASSAPTIIAPDGKVTRPAAGTGDKSVTLTATLKKGTETATKSFTLTVKQLTAYYGPGQYEDTNAALQYQPVWITYGSAEYSGGSIKGFSEAGSSFTLNFKGESIQIYGLKSPYNGIAEVFLDGVSKGTVDYYSNTAQFQQLIFEANGLSGVNHTIKLVNTGNKNPKALESKINVDYIKVKETLPQAPLGLKATPQLSKISLTWDAVNGAVGYNIYRSTQAGSGYVKLNGASVTTATYTDTAIAENTMYYYVVKTVGASGLESLPSAEVSAKPLSLIYYGPGQYEDSDASLLYQPSWIVYGHTAFSGGTIKGFTGTAASVTLNFKGGSVQVYGLKSPYNGIAEVFLDGVSRGTIDYYSSDAQFQQLIFEATGLSDANHTIKLVNTGTRNPKALESKINVDYMKVGEALPAAPAGLKVTAQLSKINLIWDAVSGSTGYNVYRSTKSGSGYVKLNSPPLTAASFIDSAVTENTMYYYVVKTVGASGLESLPSAEVSAKPLSLIYYGPGQYEDSDAALLYQPSWIVYGHTSFSGGTIKGFTGTGASVTLNFKGGSVQVYGLKSPSNGIAEVFLDGVSRGTVDYYSSNAQFQQLIFEATGLTDANHTIKLVNTGTRNPKALESKINVDYILVTGPAPLQPPTVLTPASGNGWVKLTWSGSDQAVGYTIYRSMNSGTGYERIGTVTGNTGFEDKNVINEKTYYYIVKAINKSGVESAPSNETFAVPSSTNYNGSGIYEDSANVFTFNQSWRAHSDSSYSGTTIRSVDLPDGSVTLYFTGSSIKLYGLKSPNNGIGEIKVDGVSMGNIDLYSSERLPKSLLFEKNDLSAGNHSISFLRTGMKNANALETKINFDFFAVGNVSLPLHKSIPQTIEGTAYVEQNGIGLTWTEVSGASHYVIERETVTSSVYGGSSPIKITVTQSTYMDQNVVGGMLYRYIIRAYDEQGILTGVSNPMEVMAAAFTVSGNTTPVPSTGTTTLVTAPPATGSKISAPGSSTPAPDISTPTPSSSNPAPDSGNPPPESQK